MKELSLHILDIAENGITAGADCIEIRVEETLSNDRLEIMIVDNGRGMPPEKMASPDNPFITTRTTRRVGLGLSLLTTAAQRCEGDISVTSEPGQGTTVSAGFQHSHIDRAPLGDMAATLTTLIIGNPGVDFVYTHVIDGREFSLDTREIKAQMDDLSLTDAVVIHHLGESIRNALKELESDLG